MMDHKKLLSLLSGPFLFSLIYFLGPFSELSNKGQLVMGAAFWMAAWWTTEAVPIAITAMLPLILFPFIGVMTLKVTGATYGHPMIFLFVGGFMIAKTIEKWKLHTRIALYIILKIGHEPRSIILGFMIATAFLSMWISNTATTIMMIPISLAIIEQLQDNSANLPEFTKPLLLSIAYAASIGGIATLIGTPTNVIFAGVYFEKFGIKISFANWMLFAAPIATLLLFLCWYYLTHIAFKLPATASNNNHTAAIEAFQKKLGPISYEEKAIMSIFGLVSFCWITRSFLLTPFIPNLTDPIIALIGVFLLFIIPVKNKSIQKNISHQTLLDWQTAVTIPWGIILLFGGGLSLAKAFNDSGLASWIGMNITSFSSLPILVLLLLLIASVNFLTEITSNIATVSMILPILSGLQLSGEGAHLTLMIGATLAASCAFMLPVATAPNAIVFGSGHLEIKDMIKAGFGFNILSIILFCFYVYWIVPITF